MQMVIHEVYDANRYRQEVQVNCRMLEKLTGRGFKKASLVPPYHVIVFVFELGAVFANS